MQRVNHNSTTTKALLMAPVVDLWITLKNVMERDTKKFDEETI